jgi:hypothetical protein
LDLFFLRFRSAIAKLVDPLFSFQMKDGAWYRKQDLVELMLHMAVMNGYAEGVANVLRCHGDMPTGETLLGYVKSMTREEMLANAEAQIDCCVKQLTAAETVSSTMKRVNPTPPHKKLIIRKATEILARICVYNLRQLTYLKYTRNIQLKFDTATPN